MPTPTIGPDRKKSFSLRWAGLAACALLGISGVQAQEAGTKPDRSAVLIKPTSGMPQSPQARAVCTFQCIGLYWTPDGGAEERACQVRYTQRVPE